MDYRDRITFELDKRVGRPCIRGLRITVSDVLDYLASGMTEDETWPTSRTSSGTISGRSSCSRPSGSAADDSTTEAAVGSHWA